MAHSGFGAKIDWNKRLVFELFGASFYSALTETAMLDMEGHGAVLAWANVKQINGPKTE